MINKFGDDFRLGMFVKRRDGKPIDHAIDSRGITVGRHVIGTVKSFAHWTTQDLKWAIVEIPADLGPTYLGTKKYQLLDDLRILSERDAHLLMKLNS